MSLRFDTPFPLSERSALESVREAGSDRWRFLCPECGSKAFSAGSDVLCPAEGRRFTGTDGVLPLLRSASAEALRPFLDSYREVRRAEGWGGPVDYYRGLPFASEGRHRGVWKIRARSYRRAIRAIANRFADVKKADEWDKLALRILEIGAGNGWFSWRMAQAGHYVLATDISLDEEDGLGAVSRYAPPGTVASERLTRARAEMEALPLEDSQCDLVVANGSIHYAAEIARAISEAHRVLRPQGLLLVLDSPVYDDLETGRRMVRRRQERHREMGIFDSASSAGFLVEDDFVAMAERMGIPLNALRSRAQRIRNRLEECVNGCVNKK